MIKNYSNYSNCSNFSKQCLMIKCLMTKIFSHFDIKHLNLIRLIRIIRSIRHLKQCFIFCFSVSLFLCSYVYSYAATLYFLPSSNEILINKSFVVEARLDTEKQNINTIEAKIIYPIDTLEIADISDGGSIISLWPEAPKIKDGEINFVGGIPNGFTGDGKIFSVIFKSKKIGDATLSWSGDSKILLNDGAGSEATKKLLGGNYKIVADKQFLEINSPDHPDQNKWYVSQIVTLNWEQKPGYFYSYILSKDPLAEPDDEPDFVTPEGLELSGLENGVYYFHLKFCSTQDVALSSAGACPPQNWSQKSTFRIMIDYTKPEITEAKIDKNPLIFNNQYFLSFTAKDDVSGIDKILVAEIPPSVIPRIPPFVIPILNQVQDDIYNIICHSEFISESIPYFIIPHLILSKTDKAESRKNKEGRSENDIIWNSAESPYLLKDQSRKSEIKIKAIDKAGNEIIYTIPPLKVFPYYLLYIFIPFLIILTVLIALIVLKKFKNRHRAKK